MEKNIYLKDSNGFIGKEYQSEVEKIKEKYKDWFDTIEELNKIIYDMYDDIILKKNDEIGMFLITEFTKIHKSFQACSLLYSYGLEDDVQIILRTMFDSLFISASIKKDEKNFDKLIKNQEIENNMKINDLIDLGIITDREKINVNIREKTSTWKFAQDTEYKDMYIAYSYLSSYVHVDLMTLKEKYYEEDGEIGIIIAPSVNNICFFLTEILGLMLSYVELITTYLKKDYEKELSKIKLKHIQLKKISEEIYEKQEKEKKQKI